MDALFADLRAALRSIRARPGLPVVVVLTLGIAGGATSAMLAMGDAILWRPLPLPGAERLVAVELWHERLGVAGELSVPDYLDLAAACRSCSGFGFFDGVDVLLGDEALEPQRRRGAEISAGLFPLLGVEPATGRGFAAEDAAPGAESVVLLGSRLAEALGGPEAAVGRSVLVDGSPRTVVGVMPAGFRFPTVADLWLPARIDAAAADRSDRDLDGTVTRLAPGASIATIQAELAAAARALGAAYPETNDGWTVAVEPLRDAFVRDDSASRARVLLGAAAFLVLVACANISNLLRARERARRRETAVRLALGAGRAGLVRRLLAECALLAVVGGLLGLLLAPWILDLLRAGNPEEMPYWFAVELRPGVVLGSLAVALVSGLTFGALPALRASRPDLVHALRDGGRTTGGLSAQRLQRFLVGGEIALALVLLVGAALFARSFAALFAGDAGFETGQVLTLRTALRGERFAEPASRPAFADRLLSELESLPGVSAAALTTSLPIDDGGGEVRLVVTDAEREGEETWISYAGWSGGAFSALGIPVLAGRELTVAEARDPEARVALVNRRLAERLWPGADPLGRTLRLGEVDDSVKVSVVGVVGDLQYEEFGEETPQSRLQVHLPYGVLRWPTVVLLVKAAGDPGALRDEVTATMRRLDPSLAAWDLRTMTEVRRETTWGARLPMKLLAGFALAALLLGALGVYGVTSFAVSQRVPEIGVRMALGADRAAVQRLVLGEAATTALAGVAAGLAGAAALAKVLGGLLYGVSPVDPLAFGGAALALLSAAVVAGFLPARRAARIDPMVVLRAE